MSLQKITICPAFCQKGQWRQHSMGFRKSAYGVRFTVDGKKKDRALN